MPDQQNNHTSLKLLFIINPGSGNHQLDLEQLIKERLESGTHHVHYFSMPLSCTPAVLKEKITAYKPDRVIAVGGDGTLKLVAESTLGMHLPLGIIPAGSANGMAKELGIPLNLPAAIDLVTNGTIRKISFVRINKEICIHLSDIGFNAVVVKKFESNKGRGMWGYIKAAWQVLRRHSRMEARIWADDKLLVRRAAMIVIANATRYGSGAVINPVGKLDDDVFEVVIVKKISMKELFKMVFTHASYDPEKTELLQASALQIESKRVVHFQVDGEYLGKTKKIDAQIEPGAISIIVPA